jgi:hypothetical protein
MYRSCIYCSADLGENQVLEAFPIGARIAFDAVRGRLWAICPKCGRWNLAPIEERWEPVEQAERQFRDARLRTQSENIGLAKLPDGTRLIRVGEALQGELAAWRYGDTLVSRRKNYLIATGAAVAVGVVVIGGLSALTGAGAFGGIFNGVGQWYRRYQGQKVFHHLPPERSGLPAPLLLRRWHLERARLLPGANGTLALEIPHAFRKDAPRGRWNRRNPDLNPLVLPEAEARAVLTRGSVHFNAKGADRKRVGQALELLASAGSAEGFLHDLASEPRRITVQRRARRRWREGDQPVLEGPHRLALEMALHEEDERRALEGELTVLQAAWRDAEEIAGIADRLALASGESAG